ncbi:hypothetical protein MPTK1_5g20120 [Marchantia polymorpha subsp. ruderalis]|uniref:Uncharacterized protein n=2 Tax=Marchantia polymorpha TaxID=3197 RepID=A0AAF6BKB2_MARPO|nr:hypothetical protein MARPO_0190s0008 [Marchantia polymorpha]BBN12446.1 hypothetical protein Mp_5g20120 [Marchantia polymorpha subsp. ruderalis]|eukprot:PTQ27613.1 hypothetical protein MARPO_0190s0008 [Marchantia polymorpha]
MKNLRINRTKRVYDRLPYVSGFQERVCRTAGRPDGLTGAPRAAGGAVRGLSFVEIHDDGMDGAMWDVVRVGGQRGLMRWHVMGLWPDPLTLSRVLLAGLNEAGGGESNVDGRKTPKLFKAHEDEDEEQEEQDDDEEEEEEEENERRQRWPKSRPSLELFSSSPTTERENPVKFRPLKLPLPSEEEQREKAVKKLNSLRGVFTASARAPHLVS